jgi:small-conductance mechanosensitive channel
MRRYLSDHPTLRGFLIIAVIAAVIVALSLQPTLAAISLLASIAFLLAIAFFVYLQWRERRGEISTWPPQAMFAFYGGAILIVLSLVLYFAEAPSGLDAVAFLVILGLGGFSMFRVWRDQRHLA